MSAKMNVRRHRMGGPGGGPHGMMPGEKAKDFKGTLAKTFRYMRRDVVTIVIAFVLAISSVILTLTVPDILGTATDELLGGAMQKTYYNAAIEIQDSIPELNPSIIELMGDKTLGELADADVIPSETVTDEMRAVTVAQLYAAKDATTVGEFFTALGMQDRFSVAESYRDRVLGHPVDTRDAVLHGYSKVCGWDYLTLVPSDSSVRGVVFEADVDDVARMDVWEDVPVYSLVPVTVETDDGPAEAHTYIMGTPPEHYETVDDSCVAAIPILEIMADLDRVLGRRRR